MNKILAGEARVSIEVGKCTTAFVSADLLKALVVWSLFKKAPEFIRNRVPHACVGTCLLLSDND